MTDTRTFIKLHDGIADHPKIEPLTDAAFRLLITGWCWCSKHETDGVMALAIWERRGNAKARQELIDSGLVLKHADKVEFHDYLKHQQSAAQREAAREQRRAAGRAGGQARAKRVASESSSESLSEIQAEVEVEVEQTPTVSVTPAPRTAKHPIPEDWKPSLDLLSWARSETPLVNVERESASFVDYFLDKGEKRPGWARSWKRWMRDAQERAEKRTPLRAVPADRFGSWDV